MRSGSSVNTSRNVSVITGPGATALTLIDGASSSARVWVRLLTAALAAA